MSVVGRTCSDDFLTDPEMIGGAFADDLETPIGRLRFRRDSPDADSLSDDSIPVARALFGLIAADEASTGTIDTGSVEVKDVFGRIDTPELLTWDSELALVPPSSLDFRGGRGSNGRAKGRKQTGTNFSTYAPSALLVLFFLCKSIEGHVGREKFRVFFCISSETERRLKEQVVGVPVI